MNEEDQSMKSIAWLCCTYKRPKLLGQLVHCFLTQDYEGPKQLLILDDNDEYRGQSGEGWKIISVPDRYPSLGEKRNALAAMVGDDVDILCPVDDDDLQLPHSMRAHVESMERSGRSCPFLPKCIGIANRTD